MPDTIERLAIGLCKLAEGERIPLRLFGSCAIRIKCAHHSDILDRCNRHPKDIDCVIARTDRNRLQNLLRDNGWTENVELTAQTDGRRLEFRFPDLNVTLDVSVDEVQFAQTLDIRERIELDTPTLPPADLLLTKLQIPQLTESDLIDILALIASIPVIGPNDEAIDVQRIIDVTADSWGWYRSVELSLHAVRRALETSVCPLNESEQAAANDRLRILEERIVDAPKTARWKVRRLFGNAWSFRHEVEQIPRSGVFPANNNTGLPSTNRNSIIRLSQFSNWFKRVARELRDSIKGSKEGYCDDYKKSLETYAKDPKETIDRPIYLGIVVFLSIAIALVIARVGGVRRLTTWKPITWWEVIAIVDTVFLAAYYFIDLWREAPERLRTYLGGRLNVVMGALLVVNVGFFYGAYKRLIEIDSSKVGDNVVSAYEWYLGWLTALFLTFFVLDFLFAFLSKDFRKTRSYWILCVLVDGPPVLAFLIFRLYLDVAPAANTEIMSGAVVMQMLIADVLYLLVASNLPAWLLANHLSKGCD